MKRTYSVTREVTDFLPSTQCPAPHHLGATA